MDIFIIFMGTLASLVIVKIYAKPKPAPVFRKEENLEKEVWNELPWGCH